MAIDTLLRSYPDDVQSLARAARKTLREWLPNADESVDESARMLAYRYGPGYKGMVCTIILSKSASSWDSYAVQHWPIRVVCSPGQEKSIGMCNCEPLGISNKLV